MPDLERIKGNVAKMASQQAPMQDIDGYIKSEGVTVDDVKNFKPSISSEGLGYIGKHPVKSLLQGLPETITGKSAMQSVVDSSKKTPMSDKQVSDYTKQWGTPPTDYNKLGMGDRFKAVGGAGVDAATSPSNLLGISGVKAISSKAGEIANAFKNSIHGEEFLKGASKNLRDMGNSLEGALHKAYGNFYSANGLSEVPLDSSKVDSIFLGNDLPKSTIQKIDTQIGKVDTVGKAHAARGIIRSDLSKNAFNNPSVDLTAEDTKKETMGDLKDLMRDTTRTVNPTATSKLEELDKLAYGDIYPRLLRINRLVSSDPLATEYPDTTKILSLMRGGLGKGFTQKIFSDSPEKIKQLDRYLDSPEFKQDVSKAVESSRKFSKSMDSFKGRETMKRVAGGTAVGTGVLEGINKLFGK